MLRHKSAALLALAVFCSVSSVARADSLIDPTSYRGLSSDRRAYRTGEILTVMVLESTTAESAAGTGAQNKFSIQGSMSDTVSEHHVGVGLGGDSNDAGKTTRSGRVRTQLSVRIQELLPYGAVRVAGEQSLTVNGETQTINLTGIIRQDDIGNDNIVLSNRIADAHIEIIGDGDVSDTQRQSIIFRALQWLGLI